MINKVFSKPFFKVIFRNGKEKIFFLILIFIINLSAAFTEGFSFAFIIFAINALNDKLDLTLLPSFITKFEILSSQDNAKLFTFFIVLAIILQFVRSTLNYLGQISAIHISTKMQLDLQQKIYRQIFNLSFANVSRYKTGDLIEYASSPAVMMPNFVDAVNQSLVSFFSCSALAAFLFFISVKLTLFILTSFLIVFLFQKKVVLKISNISKKLTRLQADLSKETVQNLQAIRLIFGYNRQKKALKQTEHNIDSIRNITKKLSSFVHLLTPFNEFISILMIGICLIIGPFLLKDNSIAMLLPFLTITYRLSTRAQIFFTNIGIAAKSVGFIQRMNLILQNDDKEFVRNTGNKIKAFNDKIEFIDVSFKYSKKTACAIDRISFEILKGETIAFVGPSGAGKSTILDLLTCFYEPTSGIIQFDNQNLNQLSIYDLRELLGIVSQDSFIFHGTIEDNIKFGKLDANKDDIIKVAKSSGALEFILNLPAGFQTIVGERGYRLSGGERQRIALARALIRSPQILILDEATSNLDSQSEYYIQKALEKLHHKITIIIVAHRLSTIKNADKIFLIDQGRIKEEGSHRDLLEIKGKYFNFWEIQSKGMV